MTKLRITLGVLAVLFSMLGALMCFSGDPVKKLKKQLKEQAISYVETKDGFAGMLADETFYMYIYENGEQAIHSYNQYTTQQVIMQLRERKIEYNMKLRMSDTSIFIFWKKPLYIPTFINNKNSKYEMDSLRNINSRELPVLPSLRYTGRWILFPSRNEIVVHSNNTEYALGTNSSYISQTFK